MKSSAFPASVVPALGRIGARDDECFTAKQQEEEAQIYHFRARYLDPKTSRWHPPQPALGSCVTEASGGDVVPPGLCAVLRATALNPYHCGENKPVRHTDAKGNQICLRVLVAALCSCATSVTTAPDFQFDLHSLRPEINVGNWAGLAFSAAASTTAARASRRLPAGEFRLD